MVDVTTDGVTEEVVGRRSRLVSALALTVIAVVAPVILLNRDSEVSSPGSVANGFMETRDNLDPETVQALFATDVPISDGFIEEVGQYPVFLRLSPLTMHKSWNYVTELRQAHYLPTMSIGSFATTCNRL